MSERFLGVDAGAVRVGVAWSFTDSTFAFPIEVVPARGAIVRIRELIAQYEITQVVVGMPLTMRGEHGPQAQVVEKFVAELTAAIAPTPVATCDERLTSKAADQRITTRKGKAMRDAVAAALLLEGYMAQKKARHP